MSFAGVPASIPEVRRYLVSLLGKSCGIDPLIVATELATNAITHTASGGVGGQFVMHVDRYVGRLGIRVDDQGSPQVPRVVSDDDTEDTGRGLALVERLSLRWGVRGDERSRTVWADLTLPSGQTDAVDPLQSGGAPNAPRSESERAIESGGLPP
jgi:hypothetical protein